MPPFQIVKRLQEVTLEAIFQDFFQKCLAAHNMNEITRLKHKFADYPTLAKEALLERCYAVLDPDSPSINDLMKVLDILADSSMKVVTFQMWNGMNLKLKDVQFKNLMQFLRKRDITKLQTLNYKIHSRMEAADYLDRGNFSLRLLLQGGVAESLRVLEISHADRSFFAVLGRGCEHLETLYIESIAKIGNGMVIDLCFKPGNVPKVLEARNQKLNPTHGVEEVKDDKGVKYFKVMSEMLQSETPGSYLNKCCFTIKNLRMPLLEEDDLLFILICMKKLQNLEENKFDCGDFYVTLNNFAALMKPRPPTLPCVRKLILRTRVPDHMTTFNTIFPNITELHVDASLVHSNDLCQFPHLAHIVMDFVNCDRNGQIQALRAFHVFAQCYGSKLRFVKFVNQHYFCYLEPFFILCRNLVRLECMGIVEKNDVGVEELASFEEANLIAIDNQVIQFILLKCPNIRYLTLDFYTKQTPVIFQTVLSTPGLQSLESFKLPLHKIFFFTNVYEMRLMEQSLMAFIKACPKLKYFGYLDTEQQFMCTYNYTYQKVGDYIRRHFWDTTLLYRRDKQCFCDSTKLQ